MFKADNWTSSFANSQVTEYSRQFCRALLVSAWTACSMVSWAWDTTQIKTLKIFPSSLLSPFLSHFLHPCGNHECPDLAEDHCRTWQLTPSTKVSWKQRIEMSLPSRREDGFCRIHRFSSLLLSVFFWIRTSACEPCRCAPHLLRFVGGMTQNGILLSVAYQMRPFSFLFSCLPWWCFKWCIFNLMHLSDQYH